MGPHKVPDYKIYTVGDHVPELQKTQRMLASMKLKDPWIRNEVWRYDRRCEANTMILGKTLADRTGRKLHVLLRGCGPGLALACVTAGIHYYRASQNPHGHH